MLRGCGPKDYTLKVSLSVQEESKVVISLYVSRKSGVLNARPPCPVPRTVCVPSHGYQ